MRLHASGLTKCSHNPPPGTMQLPLFSPHHPRCMPQSLHVFLQKGFCAFSCRGKKVAALQRADFCHLSASRQTWPCVRPQPAYPLSPLSPVTATTRSFQSTAAFHLCLSTPSPTGFLLDISIQGRRDSGITSTKERHKPGLPDARWDNIQPSSSGPLGWTPPSPTWCPLVVKPLLGLLPFPDPLLPSPVLPGRTSQTHSLHPRPGLRAAFGGQSQSSGAPATPFSVRRLVRLLLWGQQRLRTQLS